MPFVDGETLRAKLDRETQLGVDEAVKLITDVADALHYAHTQGIIHRDIKPDNILLANGRPMVADFGIALAVSAAAGGRMTETGLSLGTPHYMSPEQATAEKEISARSDQYSLASVLYEMLAGNPPHIGASAQQIIMKIIAEPVAMVTQFRKTVPPNVAAALAKALEKLPADRFESAKAFADALVNTSFTYGASGHGHVGASSTTTRTNTVRFVLVVGAVALAVGIAGTRMFWRDTAAPSETARLMLEFPADQQPRLLATPGSTIALLPDGSGVLYVGPGLNTPTQFWLREWDQLQATRLAQSVGEACCAVFSPTSDTVAYLTAPHQLHVMPIIGGTTRVVADSGIISVGDWGAGVDWGADGHLYASSLTGIVRVSPAGGALVNVTTLDEKRGDLFHTWPSVLPDNRGVLFTVIPKTDYVNPERHAIGFADFKTGAARVLLQGTRAVYTSPGYIVFAKAGGALWAVPFDVATGTIIGKERALADTVNANGFTAGDFSVSRNGTLTYARGIVQSLQAMLVSRNGEAHPFAPDIADAFVQEPRISSDGKQLVVTMGGSDGKTNVWLKPLDGGPKSRLTFDGNSNIRTAWRPNTNAIACLSDRERSDGLTYLFERDVTGAATVRRPELHDARVIGATTWSPDGQWLLFRTDDQTAGGGDIMGIRPGIDTVARAFVATPAEELAPEISPDGKWLSYSSNESGGQREVYVRPFPNTDAARYQISTSGSSSPAWSRSGNELFFVDAALNMMAVGITGGATLQVGAVTRLFPAQPYVANPFHRQYDVMPDGQHFLMVRGISDAQAHVVVVFNFFEELKKRMGAP